MQQGAVYREQADDEDLALKLGVEEVHRALTETSSRTMTTPNPDVAALLNPTA
ncbi:hypothetical protein D9M69_358750 [compost metagenome]